MGREKLLPVLPITVPLLVVCSHHAMGDVVVCRVEKSFPAVLLLGRNRFQKMPCGSGNVRAKWVRNVLSLGNVLRERDAMSAMRFVLPGKWNAVSGDAWHASMWRASTQIRCATVGAFVASSHVVHATVGVLSHPVAM